MPQKSQPGSPPYHLLFIATGFLNIDLSTMKVWLRSGSPWIWLNAGAVAVSLTLVFGLLALIAAAGLRYFWPEPVLVADYQIPGQSRQRVAGELVETEDVSRQRLQAAGIPMDTDQPVVTRSLLKTGNRDLAGQDFAWMINPWLINRRYPEDILVLERRQWGNFYGYLQQVSENGRPVAWGASAWPALQARVRRVQAIAQTIDDIESTQLRAVNGALERLRLKARRLALENSLSSAARAAMAAEKATLQSRYRTLESQLRTLYQAAGRDSLTVVSVTGQTLEWPVDQVIRAYRPNGLSWLERLGFFLDRLWAFMSGAPRSANTEGGVFPAIAGTVIMVLLMSVMVTPLGVLAAVYLREYAHQGWLTQTIRVAVNNLAGVPAIVYGVFGLGFFIYFLGGHIDRLFFAEALPAPTFGTPGLLWASMTLALLTLPVVIVATEEGLARIPVSLREASLALGATRAETLWHLVLPMASPAMMTGLILAVARAAGEVAPLMLVGVAKLASGLPVDGNAPYLHLSRKFMHLGFYIYDAGLQSPDVEAAKPLVYATALLLVLVIAILNLASVAIRNHLREKYKNLDV